MGSHLSAVVRISLVSVEVSSSIFRTELMCVVMEFLSDWVVCGVLHWHVLTVVVVGSHLAGRPLMLVASSRLIGASKAVLMRPFCLREVRVVLMFDVAEVLLLQHIVVLILLLGLLALAHGSGR